MFRPNLIINLLFAQWMAKPLQLYCWIIHYFVNFENENHMPYNGIVKDDIACVIEDVYSLQTYVTSFISLFKNTAADKIAIVIF